MRYFRIPIINEEPDISKEDKFDLLFYIGDGKTVYGILIDGTVRKSWEEITEDQFEEFTVGSQKQDEQQSGEPSIVDRLEKMQQQLNSMEKTQNYLIGLQIASTEDILTPVEATCEISEKCELSE